MSLAKIAFGFGKSRFAVIADLGNRASCRCIGFVTCGAYRRSVESCCTLAFLPGNRRRRRNVLRESVKSVRVGECLVRFGGQMRRIQYVVGSSQPEIMAEDEITARDRKRHLDLRNEGAADANFPIAGAMLQGVGVASRAILKPPGLAVDLVIESLEGSQWALKRIVSIEGESFSGMTTRLLRHGSRGRRCILLPYSNRLKRQFPPGDSFVAELEALQRRVRTVASKNASRTEAIKSIVVDLHGGRVGGKIHPLANVVHRFGAVPSVVLVHDEASDLTVAVYPSETTQDNPSRYCGIRSDVQKVKALFVYPEQQFLRFKEDVAFYFHLLFHQSGDTEIHRRCRSVERVLGGSIRSKLHLLKGESNDIKAVRLARKWMEEYRELFLELVTFYNFSYLLLNEIYPLIGIRPKTDYRDSFIADDAPCDSRDTQILYFLASELLRSNTNTVGNLSNEIERKFSIKLDGEDAVWLCSFADSTQFLRHVCQVLGRRRGVLSPTIIPKSGVFISFPYKVTWAKNAFQLVAAFIGEQSLGATSLIETREDGSLTPIPSVIRAKIWLSHVFVSLLPTEGSLNQVNQNYKWILRELEYARGLGKSTYVFKEHDFHFDSDLFRKGMAEYSPLDEATRFSEVLKTFIHDLENRFLLVPTLGQSTLEQDQATVRAGMGSNLANIELDLVINTVVGAVLQINPDDAVLQKRLFQILRLERLDATVQRYALTLVDRFGARGEKVEPVRAELLQLFEQIRNRSRVLLIRGEEFPIIEHLHARGKKYRANLDLIVEKNFPGHTRAEHQVLKQTIIERCILELKLS